MQALNFSYKIYNEPISIKDSIEFTIFAIAFSEKGNGSSCISKDLDSSTCNDLIEFTGSESVGQIIHKFTKALNVKSHELLQIPIHYFDLLFGPMPIDITNIESAAKSFYLLVFNP